jgi:hypothetical protein
MIVDKTLVSRTEEQKREKQSAFQRRRSIAESVVRENPWDKISNAKSIIEKT